MQSIYWLSPHLRWQVEAIVCKDTHYCMCLTCSYHFQCERMMTQLHDSLQLDILIMSNMHTCVLLSYSAIPETWNPVQIFERVGCDRITRGHPLSLYPQRQDICSIGKASDCIVMKMLTFQNKLNC